MTDQSLVTWRTYGVAIHSAFTGHIMENAPGCLLDDGTYCWTDDLPEYVKDWDVQLPDEFIAHVLKQSSQR